MTPRSNDRAAPMRRLQLDPVQPGLRPEDLLPPEALAAPERARGDEAAPSGVIDRVRHDDVATRAERDRHAVRLAVAVDVAGGHRAGALEASVSAAEGEPDAERPERELVAPVLHP